MKQTAEYSNTPYRTWQDWEGGKRRVPGIAFSWIELWNNLNPASLMGSKKKTMTDAAVAARKLNASKPRPGARGKRKPRKEQP
jgi:hypothetical protein